MTNGDEPLAPGPEPSVFRLEPHEPPGSEDTDDTSAWVPGLSAPPEAEEPEELLEALPAAPSPPGERSAPRATEAPAQPAPARAPRRERTRREQLPLALTVAALVVLAALAIIVPLRASSTFVTDVTQLAAFCLVFAGLWLLTHRMGLLSIGHGALTGCGAYAALHAVNDFGLPLLAMPLVGFVAGCAFGALLGIPALRLPKAYLALLTLSAAVVFPIVLRQLDGPLPVTLDGEFVPPAWSGIAPNDEHIWEFWIVVAWVAIAFWLLHGLLAGPIGRALVATRDEPTAAATFGVPVYRLRLVGVSLSSGLAGLAGGLMLIPVNFNDQSLYPEELSIKLFALTIAFGSTAIGGSRLITTVPAATVLVLLPVWLIDRPGWVTQGGWIGLVKSEFFLYAVLLLVAAYARSRRARAVRSYDA